MEALRAILPRGYHHAFFSALVPGTHITQHCGPTNKKLRVHLPLVGCDGARMRVADETRPTVEGQVFGFDDSHEHEVWHDGTETRITLIVDIWHPDFTDKEVKFLNYLQRSKLRAGLKQSQQQAKHREQQKEAGEANTEDDTASDFFELLKATHKLRADDAWWGAEKSSE